MRIKLLKEIEEEYEFQERLYYKQVYEDLTSYYCIIFNEYSVSHSELEVCIAKNGCTDIDLNKDCNIFGEEYLKELKEKEITKDEFLTAYRLALSKIEKLL
jgi:archaellum component FlaF (FlaF/FlaG flagellin family)